MCFSVRLALFGLLLMAAACQFAGGADNQPDASVAATVNDEPIFFAEVRSGGTGARRPAAFARGVAEGPG